MKYFSIFKDKQLKLLAYGFVALILAFTISQLIPTPSTNIKSEETEPSPDTIIPRGFVLVPIELQNAEAIAGMIEGFAIIDLYLPDPQSHKQGRRLGHKLRLLRAPLNPKTFAVLVPEQEASTVVNTFTPLIAVIQNRNIAESGDLAKIKIRNSRVQYYSGEISGERK